MAKQEGVNESLKAENQMKWVGLMNNIQAAAEEIVLEGTGVPVTRILALPRCGPLAPDRIGGLSR